MNPALPFARMVVGFAVFLNCAFAVEDDRPKVARFEDMRYPLVARVQHVEGVVVVKVEVDEKGAVVTATALSGPRELVPESILNAKKWRFIERNAGNLLIVYEFRIAGLCNQPCPSHFVVRPPNFAVITIGEPVLDHY